MYGETLTSLSRQMGFNSRQAFHHFISQYKARVNPELEIKYRASGGIVEGWIESPDINKMFLFRDWTRREKYVSKKGSKQGKMSDSLARGGG